MQLSENKELVNALNVFPVPDGDTGTNMYLTISQAVENISKLENSDISNLVKTVSKGCLMGARGNSGVILSQIFRGFASSLHGKDQISVKEFADALMMSKTTAYKAVLKPVEGTILTVIREIADYAEEITKEEISYEDFFEKIMERGKESLRNTPNLLKPLKEAGVVDSGGMGLLYILNGFYEVVHGKSVDLSEFHSSISLDGALNPQSKVEQESIEFTYCTEFILQTKDPELLELKPYIMSMGDSVVYVTDDEFLKVHVHTNEPGEVLTTALKHGTIVKTKIENMKEQHTELVGGGHSHAEEYESKFKSESGSDYVTEPEEDDGAESSKYGFVAIGSGAGLVQILKSLGINKVISGGQTMNPSTKEIHEAIEKLNVEHVFVFPNNSNIILAANQAADLSEKDVRVVPSKTVPQCIACMLAFNETADVEENSENFETEIEMVKTLQITYAIRDTVIGDIEISKNNYLGILDGSIVASDTDISTTIVAALDGVVEDDTELVSLYSGEDVSEEEAEELLELLEEKYPDVDIDLNRGDQPVYYYVISVE